MRIVAREPSAPPGAAGGESLVVRYARMAHDFEPRPVDAVLRALDVLLAGVALLALSPLLVLCALGVRASGRPVLYRGVRVGRAGRIFAMYKLRTLKPGAEERLGPYLGDELTRLTHAETTRVGRALRRAKLDELPQLVNVVRGDMSLVGPRPIRPVFFEELAHDLPAYWQRLTVRPGLTGLAQVRRGYETSMAEKLAHDLEWIADRSVRLYLRTVWATGWRVVKQSLRGSVSPSD